MHQLLMGMAVALSLIFCLRSIYLGVTGGSGLQLALGLCAVVVAAVLVGYLRRFRASLAQAALLVPPRSPAPHAEATKSAGKVE